MSGPRAHDPDRQRAHVNLMEHLERLREIGCKVPCMDHPAAEWTSEDHDDQEFVARLCSGCAGLSRCRAYIEQHPEPTSVWAGLTVADRAPRRGRPRKEKSA